MTDTRSLVIYTTNAKYKPSPKAPGINGIIEMKEDGFMWSPKDSHDAVQLDVNFKSIKSHRWSKESSGVLKPWSAMLKFGTSVDPAAEGGYIFAFNDFKERDKCKEIYGMHLFCFIYFVKSMASLVDVNLDLASFQGSSQDVTASSLSAKRPAPAASKATIGKIDMKEMQKRQKLLQSDSNLRRLHQELVIGNILKEEEFWATRKDLLDGGDSKRKRQRTGIASNLLADVRPVTDGQTNTVTFNLTPEIIAQIFAEKPAVLRSFLQFVPSKMSEREFWTKYYRAQYVIATHESATEFAEATDDEDLAVFVREDTQLAEEAKIKVQSVDPTLDIAADDAGNYLTAAGHGNSRDESAAPASQKGKAFSDKRRVVRDINRHAEVVLRGRLIDSNATDARSVAMALAEMISPPAAGMATILSDKKKDQVLRAVDMDDLHGPLEPHYVPLNIQDPKKYFNQQTTGGSTQSNSNSSTAGQSREIFRRKLQEARQGKLRAPAIDPNAALKGLRAVNKTLVVSKPGKEPGNELMHPLSDSIKGQVMAYAEAVRELLRHFWASYPVTSQMLVDKAERHKKGVDAIYDKLEKFKSNCPLDQRHSLSQILRPIFQSLNAAIEHFDEEDKSHSARRSGRTAAKF